MPESNMVDSIEETAAVDSAAKLEVNPSAEDSSPKTFTADEVDAKIKARIDKQNAKHADEVSELQKQLEELQAQKAEAESQAEALKKQQELAEATAVVATEYGIPAYMLHGENQEELTKSAEAAARFKKEILDSIGTAPIIKDSGEPSSDKIGTDDKASFVKSLFKND